MGIFGSKHDADVEDSDFLPPHTEVPAKYFATPLPLSVSGGTAQFFALAYAGPASGPAMERYGRSPTYWLGKDVAFAVERMVTVMVTACPHALGVAIPLVVAISTAI